MQTNNFIRKCAYLDLSEVDVGGFAIFSPVFSWNFLWKSASIS